MNTPLSLGEDSIQSLMPHWFSAGGTNNKRWNDSTLKVILSIFLPG